MKIGIVDDDGMLSLQGRLMDEGHDVHLWVPGVAFNDHVTKDPVEAHQERLLYPKVRDVETLHARFHPHPGFESLMAADCDLYIITPGFQFGYEALTAEGRRTIGYSSSVYALEDFRHFGKTELQKVSEIRIPETRIFQEAKELQRHLRKRTKPCVIKQISTSPATARNRTIVVHDCGQAASMLEKPNAWWDIETGLGGALIEEFAPGQEVCWGAFFNGHKFVEPLYSCIEHKGAQDGDRGSVLTGEVGTPLFFHYGLTEENSRIWKIFRQMEPLFRGKCCGLIDINTVVNYEDGSITFLEFTTRFGIPTGEVMHAMMKDSFNFGEALFKLAGPPEDTTIFQDAFRFCHGVGVAVFSYGYPLLDELVGGKENAYEICSRGLTHEIEFQFPQAIPSQAKVRQVLAGWDPKANVFLTQYNERQFVVVGFGATPREAQAYAYQPLENYWLLGNTWRNDVGDHLPELYRQGVEKGLFPASSLTPEMQPL